MILMASLAPADAVICRGWNWVEAPSSLKKRMTVERMWMRLLAMLRWLRADVEVVMANVDVAMGRY